MLAQLQTEKIPCVITTDLQYKRTVMEQNILFIIIYEFILCYVVYSDAGSLLRPHLIVELLSILMQLLFDDIIIITT